jgi:acetyl esterase
MAEADVDPLSEMTLDEARAFGRTLRDLYDDGPDVASVEDRFIPTDDGSIPVRVLIPHGDVRGVIVYYHGGGWVIGSLDEYDPLARQLADRTRCAVVNVDYRLAPEHRFPAAAHDAYAALLWTDDHVEDLVGRRVPLLVAGDSAGGNLAAVTALRARDDSDENDRAIAQQILVYPVTDTDMNTDSYLAEENQLLLTREAMAWFFDHYAPNPDDRDHPHLAPARAPHLRGLPPATVLTAEHDPLRDEGEAYARSLKTAGVPVEFERLHGQMHGFFPMVGVLPGQEKAVDRIARSVDETLSRQPA